MYLLPSYCLSQKCFCIVITGNPETHEGRRHSDKSVLRVLLKNIPNIPNFSYDWSCFVAPRSVPKNSSQLDSSLHWASFKKYKEWSHLKNQKTKTAHVNHLFSPNITMYRKSVFLSMKMKKSNIESKGNWRSFALAWLPKQKHPCLASLILVQSLPANS